jgi:Fimbrial assembly protein (PilN)
MRAVNLLPNDAAGRGSRRSLGTVGLVAIVGAALVVTALSAGYLHARSALESKQTALESAEVELEVTPKPPEGAKAVDNGLAAERAARATALASAYAGRVAWDRVLRRFALVLPDDVWLATLAGNSPGMAGPAATATGGASSSSTAPAAGGSTAGTPTGFTITGYSYSHEAVARLLSRLEVVPDLTNVQLQTSVRAELNGRDVIQFTVGADVRTGEAS